MNAVDAPTRVWSIEDQVHPEALELYTRFKRTSNADDRGKLALELMRYFRSDFPTFCGLQLKVRPKGGGQISPFLFNQVQRAIWCWIAELIAAGEPLYLVILKFRQAGMSTFWCAWLFWQMWRQGDMQTMVVAHQLPTAETMIETMRVFFDEMDDEFRPVLRKGNHGASIPRGEVYFADRRSWCLIHLADNADPRGQQVTHVLETEFAMYDDPTTLNGALIPQLPQLGTPAFLRASFVIESTPKGQNEFYDKYKQGKKGTSIWKSRFFPWFTFDEQYAADPPPTFRLTAEEKRLIRHYSRARIEKFDGKPVTVRQMFWRRMIIESVYEGNEAIFNQEYPSDDEQCFMLGSRSIFRQFSEFLLSNIREAEERSIDAWASLSDGKQTLHPGPQRVQITPAWDIQGPWARITKVSAARHPHGKWLVWEPPVDGHQYVVGGDSAWGIDDEGDPCAACVLDVTTGRQVAEFVEHCSPEELADEMASAGYWYNTALLTPEVNGMGYVTLKRLIANICYPNMFRWPKWDEVHKYTHKRGYETNMRTKRLMVSQTVSYIKDEMLKIASKELLGEMSTFEQYGDDEAEFRAQKGRHDDRVMAFMLCVMSIDQTPRLMSELHRGASAMPTARELRLATHEPPATPIPQAISKFLESQQKFSIPFNQISDQEFF